MGSPASSISGGGGGGGGGVTSPLDIDNIRIEDNTISSTNANGNITIDPNGTGSIDLQASTRVTGTIPITTTVAGDDKAQIGGANWNLGSDVHLRWFDDPDVPSGAADAGLKRVATGALQGTNGAAGALTSFRLTSTVGVFQGSGSPEGVVTAGIGSLYMRTDGGAGTSLYVKESGAGNTGWAAK